MELWREIIRGSGLNFDLTDCRERKKAGELIGEKCYKALEEIKEIIYNDELNDKECFDKIEAIIRVLEINGAKCGSRHDFG